ncbi:winged helix-turn-helix transcriptional regulator [Nostoc sp. FACHB-973]|uniref:Winged helix-turn-helix transcriptional regulator n=1 Tax=Desmonostoc muscorum LEGE 12446 TaxID=1828758 RepID=A0A8J6ZIW9_DESMC|nr:MarR family winged helix-turn-helix transcriptional regulator [Desmonostoc muscorum]MBD2519896.1 winged helix-turn-helix transcriptional regulator [Nostoc sp. FACHB-973]MBX9254946.1 winged helix-turn-helix transcriptional regulator [Desmonostoc muscorum CCALA 125]MCF2150564.1 MarR family winged helix-turn-helix transcriptional regulator [Desmonostoc muscorum LEGE 12446]
MSQADELTRCIAALADLFEVAQQSLGEAANLSKQECRVINVVGQSQSLIMREISERSGLSITNTTGIVEKLVKKGYLRRERSDEDRRIVRICLTPEGEKIYAMEVENYRKVSQAIMNALDEQEQQQMLRMMKKATRHLVEEKIRPQRSHL